VPIVLVLLIVVFVLIVCTLSKKTGIYDATVVDKTVRKTVIYSGVFILVTFYTLIMELGIEVRVKKFIYDRIQVGDSIQISRYSNGSYRLD
jgi:hypothetical protein